MIEWYVEPTSFSFIATHSANKSNQIRKKLIAFCYILRINWLCIQGNMPSRLHWLNVRMMWDIVGNQCVTHNYLYDFTSCQNNFLRYCIMYSITLWRASKYNNVNNTFNTRHNVSSHCHYFTTMLCSEILDKDFMWIKITNAEPGITAINSASNEILSNLLYQWRVK